MKVTLPGDGEQANLLFCGILGKF